MYFVACQRGTTHVGTRLISIGVIVLLMSLIKRESVPHAFRVAQVNPTALSISTMAKAESSKAAASNGIKANPNAAGGANYELPWYINVLLIGC